ncbi:MAG: response regulator [Chloroflexi bacterium]|nr:response regulator [Chloroflexota bacterium]
MVRVLVVEDEEDIRHLLVDQLQDMGHEVRKADNGAVALQRVQEETPDVIFVDIVMPVMDGLLFVAELRNDPLTASIPVVLVTAVNLTDVIMRAQAVGVKHLLAKPWEQQSLNIVLDQAIQHMSHEWDIPALEY